MFAHNTHSPAVKSSGFTPVRRPALPHYGLSPGSSAGAPWTAARCQRLLRPLTLRITTLRRQQTIPQHQQTTLHQSIQSHPAGHTQYDSQPFINAYSRAHTLEADADWQPSHGRARKPQRTYSRRGSFTNCPKATTTCTKNAVDSITKQNIKNEQDSSATSNGEAISSKQLRDAFCEMAKRCAQDGKVFEGLYTALDSILRSTIASSTRKRIGAPSLVSSCLQKVPARAALAPLSCNASTSSNRLDLMMDIYEDLETLAPSAKTGWRPLRELLRAHAIRLLCDAISEHLIPIQLVAGLAALCRSHQAIGEADQLCTTRLQCMSPLNMADPCTQFLIPGLFSSSCDLLRRDCVIIKPHGWRRLATAVQLGKLPVTAFSTYPLRLYDVTTAIHSGCVEATAFLEILFAAGCHGAAFDYGSLIHQLRLQSRQQVSNLKENIHHHEDSLEETSFSMRSPGSEVQAITHVLAHFISVCFFRQSRTSQTSMHALWTLTTTRLYEQNLLDHLAGGQRALPTSVIIRRCLPALASYLYLPADDSSYRCCSTHFSAEPALASAQRALAALLPTQDQHVVIEGLGTFVYMLACASIPECRLEKLQTYVARLALLADTPSIDLGSRPSIKATVARIAICAAFEHAEESSRQHDLDWALRIEDDMQVNLHPEADSKKSISMASEGSQHTSGRTPKARHQYRWERSIGEWITRTPLPQRENSAISNKVSNVLKPKAALELASTRSRASEASIQSMEHQENDHASDSTSTGGVTASANCRVVASSQGKKSSMRSAKPSAQTGTHFQIFEDPIDAKTVQSSPINSKTVDSISIGSNAVEPTRVDAKAVESNAVKPRHLHAISIESRYAKSNSFESDRSATHAKRKRASLTLASSRAVYPCPLAVLPHANRQDVPRRHANEKHAEKHADGQHDTDGALARSQTRVTRAPYRHSEGTIKRKRLYDAMSDDELGLSV